MKLITINDTKNPYLKIYHQLRDNAFTHDNSFIADSPKVVNLLLEQDIEIKSILATQSYYDQFRELILSKNIPMLFVADKKIMESIVGHKIHHNVMMHGIRPKQVRLEDLDDNIIMLDIISSTENIGSIARSAAALGVNSYLTPSQAPHPYGRRAIRVSMGYISMLKTHIYDDIFSTIQRLKEMGYTIFGAEITSDSIALSKIQIPEKWVLLMGHEGKGLSQEVIEICDILVEVEMVKGIKSFNVGVAASILMYQFRNKQIIK